MQHAGSMQSVHSVFVVTKKTSLADCFVCTYFFFGNHGEFVLCRLYFGNHGEFFDDVKPNSQYYTTSSFNGGETDICMSI